MPQMMPMSWLILFTMFIMTLLMFNSINYYSNILLYKSHGNKNMILKYMNWKW
uniref:ATP synthase complex subunit 8 n=1 Tax=Arenivaga sp. B097 TaxID=2093454 RepID=A0A2P1H8Q1_9NEOP|nr:ATP synthase F0 subunit 8 [Arenivaga sp. B097]